MDTMHVFQLGDPDSLAVRTHPWSGSLTDGAHRHYDLRREPALIRTSLEDWRGWERYPATETFYRLLEWLNGADSSLETSDCAFNGPAANDTETFDKALQCSGRLMLLFRDLPLNTDTSAVHTLTNALAHALSRCDPSFQWGVIGVTVVPVRYATLPATHTDQLGAQLMLSPFAWGDDEVEAMAHMDRTLRGLTSALREVDA